MSERPKPLEVSEDAETLRPPKPAAETIEKPEAEQIWVANSFDMALDEEGKSEKYLETVFGSLDASTSIGGPVSHYAHNEDGFVAVAKPDELFAAVMDGVGGSPAGRLAARVACEVLEEKAKLGWTLEQIFDEIDRRVKEKTKYFEQSKKGRVQRASSLTCAALHLKRTEEGKVLGQIAWSGDCKVMAVNNGHKIAAGTSEFQNEAQRLVDEGIIMPWDYFMSPWLNNITGRLGGYGRSGRTPDFSTFEHSEGNQYILASDGFWDAVSEYEVEQLSLKHKGRELQKALFDLAYDRAQAQDYKIEIDAELSIEKRVSSGDNITVMVVST